MKITTTESTSLVILESENKKLRTLIGDLASQSEYELDSIFSWWNEDNTGNIQIDCSLWAQGFFEEFLDIEKHAELENKKLSSEEWNLANELLDIMIEFEKTNKDSPFIEYGE